jgi:imidazolonepropionase-like amidohydrolase
VTRTIFCNAHLLDGVNPGRHGISVVVDDQRIVEVAPDAVVTPKVGDVMRHLGGQTLMPGMVTGHYHVAYDHVSSPEDIDMKHSATYATLVAARTAELTLRCGYTGAVGAACIHNIDVTLKKAIADGLIQGPRLLASSRDLCTTAGPVDTRPEHWGPIPDGVARLCDGPDEFRKAVRQEIKLGVDVIKIHVTGGHGVQCDAEDVIMTDAELRAAVATAHGLGRKIRGHVASKRGILQAVDCGMDIVDHADGMDEECIERLVAAGTFVVPSAYLFRQIIDGGRATGGMPPEVLDAMDVEYHRNCQAVAAANKAGVKLVPGDDYGTFINHGDYSKELELYVTHAGVDPLDVLRWATRNGAEMLGMGDQLGTVEVGKLADLLVVDGDPSTDITVLQDRANIRLVMKDGVPAVDTL